jgi:hypothetical protein
VGPRPYIFSDIVKRLLDQLWQDRPKSCSHAAFLPTQYTGRVVRSCCDCLQRVMPRVSHSDLVAARRVANQSSYASGSVWRQVLEFGEGGFKVADGSSTIQWPESGTMPLAAELGGRAESVGKLNIRHIAAAQAICRTAPRGRPATHPDALGRLWRSESALS